MARVTVAVDAHQHVAAGLGRKHWVHQIGVAVETGILRDPSIARLDLDRLVEIFQRECQRMKKTIVRLGDPFADRVVRQMAVIADGHVAVAGILPRVVVTLHHVAVSTGRWIVAEVAPALPVAERESSGAPEGAKHHSHQQRKEADSGDKPQLPSASPQRTGQLRNSLFHLFAFPVVCWT